jgi:hypothetical protein
MLQDGRWEIHLASDGAEIQASIDNIDEAIEIANESEKLTQVLEWFNSFVDFVENVDRNLYNQACEYADKTEE